MAAAAARSGTAMATWFKRPIMNPRVRLSTISEYHLARMLGTGRCEIGAQLRHLTPVVDGVDGDAAHGDGRLARLGRDREGDQAGGLVAADEAFVNLDLHGMKL